jgi:hypothetical protein
MAFVWARQIRARTFRAEAGKLAGQRIYKVFCNSKTDDPDTAINGCPIAPQSAWSAASPKLRCTAIDAKEATDAPAVPAGAIYEVTFDYSTAQASDPSQQDPDPLARPPVVRLGFDSFEETVFTAEEEPTREDAAGNQVSAGKWAWGKAIVNSAGQQFDPSITDCFRDPVITIEKNMATLPLQLAEDFIDKVNGSAFNIVYRGQTFQIKEKTAWVFDINTEPGYENDTPFEHVTVVLKIRKDGWDRLIRDEGLYELTNGDLPLRPILDSTGLPVMQPALLNGGGKKLTDKTPVFLRYRRKKLADFGSFGALFK